MRNARCSLCLSMNRRTVNVLDTNLLQLYEKLADYKIRDNECWMCFICHTRLQQCQRLQQLAVQTRGLIYDLCQNKLKVTLREFKPVVELSLIKTQIVCSTTDQPEMENFTLQTTIKLEPSSGEENEDTVTNKEEQQVKKPCVDSEDDVPLISLKSSTPNDVSVEHSSECKPTLISADPCASQGLTLKEEEERDLEERQELIARCTEVVVKIEYENDGNGFEQDKQEMSEQENTDFCDGQDRAGEAQPSYENPHGCDACFRTYACKSQLLQHIKVIHKGEKPFTCDICQRKFSYSNVLKNHLRTHTGEKPFGCDVCQKRFTQQHHLRIHMTTHNSKSYFSCHICSKKYLYRSGLNAHIRQHTGDQPYSCSVCFRKFVFEKKLIEHMQTHSNEQPYSCEICAKKFKSELALKLHTRIHSGIKPYSCDFCSWEFLRKSDLNEHRRTHTGEKPHSCHFCQKEFSRKSNLKVHLRRHVGDKRFSCDVCSQKYVTKDLLRRHILRHHN